MGVGDPLDEDEEDVEVRDLSRTLGTTASVLGTSSMRTWRSGTSKTTGTPSGTSLDVGGPLRRCGREGQRTSPKPWGPFFMGLGDPLDENQEDVEVRGPS